MNIAPKVFKVYQSPFVILGSIVLAVIFGINLPSQARTLGDIGNAYLSFLQLGVIPIIFGSIVSSVYALKKNHDHTKRTLSFFAATAFFISFLGIIIAVLCNFGNDIYKNDSINEIISKSEHSNMITVSLDEPIEKEKKTTIGTFLLSSVPYNIFESLADGKIMQILIFSILFGFVITKIHKDQASKVLGFVDTTTTIFKNFINLITYFLPVGIFFIVAGLFSQFNKDVITPLAKILIFFNLTYLVLIFASMFLIAKITKKKFPYVISAMKEPLVIAATTFSSILAMPSAIKVLTEKFDLDKDSVNLLIPVGITSFRYGAIFFFSFISVFVAQVYHVALAFSDYLIILIGAVMAGIAASSSGVVNLKFISIVLIPLGLPSSFVFAIFSLVDWFIDSTRTSTNLLINMAITAFRSQKTKRNSNA